jgi:hypothetical protein
VISFGIKVLGIEVKSGLRSKVSGLMASSKKFPKAKTISAAGVLKWEQALDKRLALVNEAGVRAFCAEHLGVEFEGTWRELVADDKTPKKVSVKLPIAA